MGDDKTPQEKSFGNEGFHTWADETMRRSRQIGNNPMTTSGVNLVSTSLFSIESLLSRDSTARAAFLPLTQGERCVPRQIDMQSGGSDLVGGGPLWGTPQPVTTSVFLPEGYTEGSTG